MKLSFSEFILDRVITIQQWESSVNHDQMQLKLRAQRSLEKSGFPFIPTPKIRRSKSNSLSTVSAQVKFWKPSYLRPRVLRANIIVDSSPMNRMRRMLFPKSSEKDFKGRVNFLPYDLPCEALQKIRHLQCQWVESILDAAATKASRCLPKAFSLASVKTVHLELVRDVEINSKRQVEIIFETIRARCKSLVETQDAKFRGIKGLLPNGVSLGFYIKSEERGRFQLTFENRLCTQFKNLSRLDACSIEEVVRGAKRIANKDLISFLKDLNKALSGVSPQDLHPSEVIDILLSLKIGKAAAIEFVRQKTITGFVRPSQHSSLSRGLRKLISSKVLRKVGRGDYKVRMDVLHRIKARHEMPKVEKTIVH